MFAPLSSFWNEIECSPLLGGPILLFLEYYSWVMLSDDDCSAQQIQGEGELEFIV